MLVGGSCTEQCNLEAEAGALDTGVLELMRER
jgi:hypothetical protein